MTPQPVFIAETFARLDAPWAPRRVGRVDDHDVNPVRLQGTFHGYVHAGAGEMFRVGGGVLRMQFRKWHEDAGQGAFIIIPGGMGNKPEAPDGECVVMLFETSRVVNTGDGVACDRTVAGPDFI